MTFQTIQISSPSPATKLVNRGDGSVLVINLDPNNTVYLSNTNSGNISDPSVIPFLPGETIGFDGSLDVYGFVAAGKPAAVAQIPGGLNYFLPVTTLTLPFGATSGARIRLDGQRGIVEIFDTNNNLVGVWAGAAGSDYIGNGFTNGLTVGSDTEPQILLIPGTPGAQGSQIAFPFNTADDTGSTTIMGAIQNQGLANQYLELLIGGPINQHDPNFDQYQVLYSSAADDNSQNASMLIIDAAQNVYLGFSNTGLAAPQMSIGQPPAGIPATGYGHTFVPIALNGAFLTYSTSSGGQVVKTFASSGSWTCPVGVTSARVQAWASGAGGQWASGPGGGSGEYAEEPNLAITPGDVYTVTVPSGGAGGTSSSGTGKAGSDATFALGSSVLVHAHGAPVNNTNPSHGGSGSTNSVHYPGAGCNASTTGANQGGGGGAGSPSPTAAGNPGFSNSGSAPGAGGHGPYATGGSGGWGGSSTTAGGAGGNGGAGGGSGGASASAGSNGGLGGRAQVIITYTQPGTTSIQASFSSAAGTDAGGNGYPAGFQGNLVAVEPGVSPSVPESWHTIAPVGAWSNASGRIACKYRMIGSPPDEVEVIGSVEPSSNQGAPSVVFTLPVGYRPNNSQSGVARNVTGAVTTVMSCDTGGNVDMQNPVSASQIVDFHFFISLDA